MKLRDFLKDKFIHLITMLTFVILISALLRAFKTDESCIIVVAVMIVIMNGGLLVYEFLKKRAFYIVLNENIRELDKKYIVVETLPKAEFFEGKILIDTIYDINTSTRDEVNKLYDSVREFTEYVEMWIHEIKLPIASLVLMNYNGTSDKIKQSIALKKLENYVDQILYFVRSDTPEKDYVMKNYNLEEIVNQVVKDNKELLIGSRIQIRKSNLSMNVVTDAKWMMFIVGQIVANSIKYKRSENAYISFEGCLLEDRVVLEIEDNGIGIPLSDIDRVFDKSFTGENGRSGKKSTGMGLYISKRLVDKLGHTIAISSEYGSFTKVTISFGKNDFYLLNS